jgi:hypothetical protein
LSNLSFIKTLNMNIGSIPWNADTLAGVSGLQEQEKWGLAVISNIPNLTQDQMNQLTDISALDPVIISALAAVTIPEGINDSQLRAVVNSLGGLLVSDLGLVAKKRFAGNQDFIKTIYAPNKQVCINNIPAEILCLYGLNKTAIVQSIYSKFTEIDCAYLDIIAELKKITMPQLARLTSGVYSTANLSARIRAMDLSGDCGGTAYKSTSPPGADDGGGGGGGGSSILGIGNYPQVTTWASEYELEGNFAFTYKYGTLDLAPRVAPSTPSHPPDPGQAVPYLTRWTEKPYPDTGVVYSKVEVGGSFLIGKYQDPTSVNTSFFDEGRAEGTKVVAPVTLHSVLDPGSQRLAWRPNDVNPMPSRMQVLSYASSAVEAETAPAIFRDRTVGNTIWTSGHKWYAFKADSADLTTTSYSIGSIKLWLASPIPNTIAYYRCAGIRIYSNLFSVGKEILCEFPVKYYAIEPILPNGGTEITIPLNFRIDNSFDTYIVVNNEDRDVKLAMLQPVSGLSAYWVSEAGNYWVPVIIS